MQTLPATVYRHGDVLKDLVRADISTFCEDLAIAYMEMHNFIIIDVIFVFIMSNCLTPLWR